MGAGTSDFVVTFSSDFGSLGRSGSDLKLPIISFTNPSTSFIVLIPIMRVACFHLVASVKDFVYISARMRSDCVYHITASSQVILSFSFPNTSLSHDTAIR